MNYESKAWAEAKGACLRNFNEQGDIDSVNGALALRPKIEKIVDQIWEEGFDNIYFIGIGGTYASAMQVEVYMRGKSSLPVYVENAAEYLTTGNKRLTDRSVVIYSTVSGNTKEMVQLIDTVKARGVRVFAFIDTPGSTLTREGKWDYLVLYPKNEQLKFFMVANYLMYKNGEFPDYDRYNQEMEAHLALDLVNIEKFPTHGPMTTRKEGCLPEGASRSSPLLCGCRQPVGRYLLLCHVLLGRADVDSHQVHYLPRVLPRYAGNPGGRYPCDPVHG